MQISPEQKRSLAKYRKLIGSSDWGSVNQALELLKVNGDLDLWRIFSDGVRVWSPGDAGNPYSIIIPKEAEIYKKVKAPYREVVALSALLAIGKLETEEGLCLENCQFISDLSFIQNLKDLTRLTLSLSDLPINLSPLRHLKKLDMLSLQGLKGISDVSVFEELPTLKTLWMSFCPSISNFNSISHLRSLDWAVIDFCHSLDNLNSLRELKMLRILRISTCSNLTDYSALENLSSLEELSLSGLKIGDGSFLSGMTGLKKADFFQSDIDDISSIKNAQNLTSLSISYLGDLKDLTPIGELDNLEFLSLQNCDLVENLEPLFDLPKLEKVYLGLKSIKSIDQLQGLTNIKQLTLYNSAIDPSNVRRLRRLLPDCQITI